MQGTEAFSYGQNDKLRTFPKSVPEIPQKSTERTSQWTRNRAFSCEQYYKLQIFPKELPEIPQRASSVLHNVQGKRPFFVNKMINY